MPGHEILSSQGLIIPAFMEQDKKKIREPYTPEGTPQPPQIIDPSGKNEKNEKDPPVKTKTEQKPDADKKAGALKEKAPPGDGSEPRDQR